MGRGPRPRRSESSVPLVPPAGSEPHALLLRWSDLARDRVRERLERGEGLVDRLRSGFSASRDWAQLVHCATDGESYGHHKRFGDMALAAVVQQVEAEKFATLTNYGAFLAAHPPRFEAQIRQATSWSCAHGVERWRRD